MDDMRVFNMDNLATNAEANSESSQAIRDNGSDLDILNCPQTWPYRPMACLVRRGEGGGFPECGCIHEAAPGVVYLVNLFELAGVATKDLKSILEGFEKEEHGSWQGVLDAGWRVD